MRTTPLLLLSLLVSALLASCASVWDLAESPRYRDFIGKRFALRHDCYLSEAAEKSHYDVVPFQLENARSGPRRELRRLALLPAGTVVTVVGAKRTNVGGKWDYVLARVKVPGRDEEIVFEELLGISAAPTPITQRWSPIL